MNLPQIYYEVLDKSNNYNHDDSCKNKQKIEKIIIEALTIVNEKKEVFYILGKMQEKIDLACFTKKHDSMYFWSHYANNHKGIAIEYEINDKNFSDPRNYYGIGDVKYEDDVNKIIEEALEEMEPKTSWIKLLFYKSKSWKIEEEIRIYLNRFARDYESTSHKGNKDNCKICNGNKLTKLTKLEGFNGSFEICENENHLPKYKFKQKAKAIYLGLDVEKNSEFVAELKKIAQEKNIPLLKMIENKGSFKLKTKIIWKPNNS